ncbi:uncharacterized protein [Fopius arisanus]|uniref:Uncharacterized protein isoform X2 n=1 Tax=Fopius arisanus TaxID=64838 RepID=A0A9R1T8J9_9HYME|nr:PREDICTED: uncharacterized protein LOC105267925 isoform X2 [Fopius arisanus]
MFFVNLEFHFSVNLISRFQIQVIMELSQAVEEEKIYPTYLQKELYEIQIKDITNRIERLDDRNYDVLDICEDIKKDIEFTDIKTSDEITGINRELYAELSKIDNRKSEIRSVEQQRIDDQEKHERKVDEFNEKYRVTFRALVSKIKTLNAKVNALEDYKNKRENLREKLKSRDELYLKTEEEVTQKLQKIKIQYKIDRAALLDDLQNQIFQRGIAYEAENSAKTGPLTRGLFNNNIFMRNEISAMYQEINHGRELCGEKK